MTDSPTISIIIPVYNNAAELKRCLESLEKSELRHQSEIIVIDDCSPEEGPVIEQTAQKYNAMFYRQSNNTGPGVARNRGVQESKGNILVFIDSDCVAPKGWLTKLIQPILSHEYVASTSCYCGPVSPSWITTFQDEDYRYRMPSIECKASFVNSCNFAIDRQALLDCGGFPEQRISHDMVLGLILAKRGTPVWYLPEAGVLHDYCSTVNSYLRQRFSFAYNTVGSLLDRSEVRPTEDNAKVSSFNPLRTAFGMFFADIALISFVLSGAAAILQSDLAGAFVLCGLGSLALETVVHGRFLIFLAKRMGPVLSISYIPLLYAIDLVYSYAVLKAVVNGFFKIFGSKSKSRTI